MDTAHFLKTEYREGSANLDETSNRKTRTCIHKYENSIVLAQACKIASECMRVNISEVTEYETSKALGNHKGQALVLLVRVN